MSCLAAVRRIIVRAFGLALIASSPASATPGTLLESTASTAPAASIDATMRERSRACTGCHGEQGGAGPDGYYPRLAGKPTAYLYLQLRAFRDGERRYPPMERLLRGLPDAYLRDFAAYFAALDVRWPPPPAAQANAVTLARGEAIVHSGDAGTGRAACTECHGAALLGDGARAPGLLGLSRDYLNAQLGAWRTGQRRTAGSECMADVVESLAPADIAAITAWIGMQSLPTRQPAGVRAGGSAEPDDRERLAARDRLRATVERQCPAPPTDEAGKPRKPEGADDATVERGRYLARAGHCAGCHSKPGAAAYSGGPALVTGFGSFFAPNITPDPVNGIGGWSGDDFYRALHEGVSRDGHALYPAFPYLWYTRLTRADSDAIHAWLQTLPPSPRARTAHQLPFPVNLRVSLSAWRAIWFKPQHFKSDPSQDETLERGRYIGEVLGHCGACHTGRNWFGAPTARPSLNGAAMPDATPGAGWQAPSLRDPAQGALAGWTTDAIAAWLRTGSDLRAVASGPMGEIIHSSLQHLSEDDATALATWLASLAPATSDANARHSPTPATGASIARGRDIYEAHCADCHGDDGGGSVESEYPALAGNPQVVAADPRNLVTILRHGGFSPATSRQPRPAGMPPFATLLDPREMASVLDYIRNSWGNSAPALRAGDIE